MKPVAGRVHQPVTVNLLKNTHYCLCSDRLVVFPKVAAHKCDSIFTTVKHTFVIYSFSLVKSL